MRKLKSITLVAICVLAAMSSAWAADIPVSISACGTWSYGTNYGSGNNPTALFSVDFQQAGNEITVYFVTGVNVPTLGPGANPVTVSGANYDVNVELPLPDELGFSQIVKAGEEYYVSVALTPGAGDNYALTSFEIQDVGRTCSATAATLKRPRL